MLGVVPGVAAAALPRMTCPACWPAYAGLLGSVGLPVVVLDAWWLFPVTAVALVVALGVLAFRRHQRRGTGPLILGLVASVLVLMGKFAFESPAATYGGTALLIGASVWNAWPARRVEAGPRCARSGCT